MSTHVHPQRGDPLKAFRHSGDSSDTEQVSAQSEDPFNLQDQQTGIELSTLREWLPLLPSIHSTPLLDALFGTTYPEETTETVGTHPIFGGYTPSFSPTVGADQAEAFFVPDVTGEFQIQLDADDGFFVAEDTVLVVVEESGFGCSTTTAIAPSFALVGILTSLLWLRHSSSKASTHPAALSGKASQ